MLRFYYVILISLPFIIYYLFMAEYYVKNRERYDEVQCYDLAKRLIGRFQKNARIRTISYGEDNLPDEGGYIMYSNHQGKYDVYGIVSTHKKPCTFVMDIRKSNRIFIKQIVDCIHAKRLDKIDNRQAIKIINDVAKEVEAGRRYVLFPEGDFYPEKKNTLMDFKSGCFKASLKSKTPIVPVVLYDSYKVYNSWQLGKVKTQVHFLKPIQFEEYKDLKTHEIADLVKSKIQEKIDELDKRV